MPSALEYELPRQARTSRSRAAVSSSSSGTTRLTRPQSAAVAASIVSPVKASSAARLRPMLRATATIGVWQNSPPLPPGVAKPAEAAGHDQVAAGHQLAAGRRGQALHPGQHDLGHPTDERHDLGAQLA